MISRGDSSNVHARRRPVVLALAFCLALAVTPALAGPEQSARFDTRVELVQLQVRVVDEDGGFVSGLGPEDFRLRVDGEERRVESAYPVDLGNRSSGAGAVAAPAPGSPSVESLPPAALRRFVLFFDLSYTSRQGMLRARHHALDFLDSRIHPEDLVAVAVGDRYGVRLLAPFTAVHSRARRAIEALGLDNVTDLLTGSDWGVDIVRQEEGPWGNIGSPSNIEKGLFQARVGDAERHVERLNAFGEMLQAVEGRKHVLLFSRGLDDEVLVGQGLDELAFDAEARLTHPKNMLYDTPEIAFGSSDLRAALDGLVATFREADALVHAIDPTGLRVADLNDVSRLESAAFFPEWMSETARRSVVDGHQSLSLVASGTGGTTSWYRNDLEEPLARIAETTANYYVIAYRKSPEDPPTVELEVGVRAVDARVADAPTRLTPPPDYADMTSPQRQLGLAELLYDDTDRGEIGFGVEIVPYAGVASVARTLVAFEVPGPELDRLARLGHDDIVDLEIGAFAFGSESNGEVLQAFRRGVRVDVGAMRARGSLFEQSFRYADYLDLPAGEHRVRAVVRELELGDGSGLSRRVSAAPVTSASLARPLLVRVGLQDPAPVDGVAAAVDPLLMEGRRLIPVADPQVTPGDELLLFVVGYRLPRDADGSLMPGLSLTIEAGDDSIAISDFQIVGVVQDEQTEAVRLLVRAVVPPSVAPGAARLRALLSEPASGERWVESTGLVVLSGRRPGGSGALPSATVAGSGP